MIKIGDKIVCDNGHTYTIGKGNDRYDFSLIDEFGEEVNQVTKYHLSDCMPWHDEEQRSLCVYQGGMKDTHVKKYLDCNKENIKDATIAPEMKLEKFIKDNSGIWDLNDTYEFIMEYKNELLELIKDIK